MQTDTYDPPKIAYSIKEACKTSSSGRTKIYAMLADPACPLKAVRIGGRTVIPAESLHALIAGEA
jgi:predicted DNA-binding transcriptional regulator AlpA|tara:strand:+ start:4860 stop:5054 length:195 start_codon:yes stop_codon:yes gene_type:complete